MLVEASSLQNRHHRFDSGRRLHLLHLLVNGLTGYKPPMRRAVPIILALEIALLGFAYLYFCHRAGPFGFPLDDSWIHAHFARNIAEGRGIVYNPGQHVTSTAMLYSLLLAGLYAVTKAAIANAIALGLALHFAGAILVYMTGRRLSLSPILAASAAVFFAAIPRLVWGALSGMEIPLYVFLVCLGLYWHVRYTWRDGAWAYLPTLAFGLAALARPECAAFVVCSLADRLLNYLRFGRKDYHWLRVAKAVPVHVALFCAVVAPVALYNLSSYGKPLPPAYYAKTRQISAPKAAGGKLSADISKTALYMNETATVVRRDNVILYVLLIPGLVACFAAARKADNRGVMILPTALLFIPLATAFAAPMGPHRSLAQLMAQHGRYSAYLCPLLVLIGVLGVSYVRDLLSLSQRRWPGRAFAAGILAVTGVLLATSNWAGAHRYGLEVQNINDMQVAFGKWAASLPKDTVVAVNDAGAVPYFSRLRIIDTVGVVNPEVLPYLSRYDDREPGLLEYLQERRPQYVIIFPNWYKHIARRRDILHPVKSIKLEHNLVCGGPEMIAYRASWR